MVGWFRPLGHLQWELYHLGACNVTAMLMPTHVPMIITSYISFTHSWHGCYNFRWLFSFESERNSWSIKPNMKDWVVEGTAKKKKKSYNKRAQENIFINKIYNFFIMLMGPQIPFFYRVSFQLYYIAQDGIIPPSLSGCQLVKMA